MKAISPAQAARLKAGFTLQSAAKKLRVSARTVRDKELHGRASDLYCVRAARLFGCDGELFFHPPAYVQAKSNPQDEKQ